MKKLIIIILYGFLSWLTPFVISIFFYTKNGQLTIDLNLFKSIMVLVGVASGAFLLALFFTKLKQKNYLKQGITVGIIWFAINIIFDLFILIPMSKMGLSDYFMQIGLRYLSIPLISIAMGFILQKKSS